MSGRNESLRTEIQSLASVITNRSEIARRVGCSRQHVTAVLATPVPRIVLDGPRLRLRINRSLGRLSISAVAALAGIHDQTLSAALRGRPCTPETVAKICDRLGCEPRDIRRKAA